MKVKIGKYKHWFGPYQLAEALCWWVKPVKDEFGIKQKPFWVHNFGEWLSYGSVEPPQQVGEIRSFEETRNPTLLYKFLLYVDSLKKRKISVKIDKWDTYSLDNTLAHIILPSLLKFREDWRKHGGSPRVDLEDVPEWLHPYEHELEGYKRHEIDHNWHDRWEWVLEQMIHSFRCEVDPHWEDKFFDRTTSFKSKKLDNGMLELLPDQEDKTDYNAYEREHKKIKNGFRLFGKYYQGLWT